MATNFPTSLDTFTNPNSGNTLDSPSHSIQHSDINDAVEAIEAKIGVGSSTAGSATAGYALVNTSGGTTAYSLLGVSGLSSGTAVANTFLRANGSGAATFAPIAQGLTLLIPSSVAVGSGTGTVSATGTVDFSGASSVSINDVFSATYTNYKIILDTDASDSDTALNMRMRVSGTDNSSNNYRWASGYKDTSAGAIAGQSGSGLTSSFRVLAVSSAGRCFSSLDIFNPFTTEETGYVGNYFQIASVGFAQFVAANMSVTTSYTGFTLLTGAGTMTGNVSVYGFNK
jgi:hypothetical protein